ncbi:hypothetical protein J6590_042292 [Homalodisca vitripennis]|nr:hypothetical protein J6590_042292 [Homalodisca vitripennis]
MLSDKGTLSLWLMVLLMTKVGFLDGTPLFRFMRRLKKLPFDITPEEGNTRGNYHTKLSVDSTTGSAAKRADRRSSKLACRGNSNPNAEHPFWCKTHERCPIFMSHTARALDVSSADITDGQAYQLRKVKYPHY